MSMEYPWNWDWMTAGECADYWNGLMRAKSQQVLDHVDASSTVGFYIHWGTYSMNTAVDMFIIDPLRLGSGCGEAASTSSWISGTLGVLSDVGRAMAFLPMGKLVKAVPKKLPSLAGVKSGAAPPAPLPLAGTLGNTPGRAAAAAAKPAPAQSYLHRFIQKRLIYVDPAGDHKVCAFVTLVQALRRNGRIFIEVEDIARLVGVRKGAEFFSKLEGQAPRTTREIYGWLQRLKIRSQLVSTVKNVDELMRFAAGQQAEGVYVFAAKWWKSPEAMARGMDEISGHVMYVARNAAGEVRIFDRSGHSARSLAELERMAGYKNIGSAHAFAAQCEPIFIPQATLLENTVDGVKIAGSKGAPFIAIPVLVGAFMTGKGGK